MASYNVNSQATLNTALAGASPIDITVTGDFTMTAKVTISGGKTVTITGDTPQRTILRGVTGALFTVSGSGTKLRLYDIVIDGNKGTMGDGGGELVAVNAGGTAQSVPNLVIGAGATLQNVSAPSRPVSISGGAYAVLETGSRLCYNSGAVSLTDAASQLHINGGSIDDNVYVWGNILDIRYGKLYMSSGSVSYNDGLGIYLTNGSTFTMDGGVLEHNIFSGAGAHGGAIDVNVATFIMNGGVIQYNSSPLGGGVAVHAESDSTARINAGSFIGNEGFGENAVGAGILFFNKSGGAVKGSIYVGVDTSGKPTGHVEFIDNKNPRGTAGAIGVTHNGDVVPVTLPTASQLLNTYWPRLHVGPDVVFRGNQSKQGYDISAAACNTSSCFGQVSASVETLCAQFRALAATNVLTTSATAPFIYAYNDFDIQMPVGCSVRALNVTFESNGGTSVPPQSVPENGVAMEPTPPARDGYVFNGWHKDTALKNLYNFLDTVTANITLYAKWLALAQATVTAQKSASGKALTAGLFTFELVDENGNVVAAETNDANGNVTFPALQYSATGTHHYYIREAPL